MVIKMETLISTVKIKMTDPILRETFAPIVGSVQQSLGPRFLPKVAGLTSVASTRQPLHDRILYERYSTMHIPNDE